MIEKIVELVLTDEEIKSPEPIQITLRVRNGEDCCDYTITYPKGNAEDFGWDCPESPDGKCHYYTEVRDGVRGIVLKDGEFLTTLPPDHDPEKESEDGCIYCGEPEERK